MSLFQPNEECCYVCGRSGKLHEHHIFGGYNRDNSERDGLKAYLCSDHHNFSDAGVHFNRKLDLILKERAEKIWIDTYTDSSMPFDKRVQEFIKVYKRNYIDY